MRIRFAKFTFLQSPRYASLQDALEWWYLWTAPPLPPARAPFKQRDETRRARAGSILLLVMSVIMLLTLAFSGLKAIFIGNAHFPFIVVAMLLLIFFLCWLNRRGKITVVASILITSATLSTLITMINQPDGIPVLDLRLYDNLIGSLLLAVLLLPLRSIFLIALVNLLLVIASLYFFASTALVTLLQTSFAAIVAPFAGLEIQVVLICWLWGTSMMKALQRADRAEEIAKLEQSLSAQNRAAIEEKQRLEDAIRGFVATMTAVANGNYRARVPINQSHVLWPLVGAFNNLLGRIEGWRRDSLELKRLRQAVTQLTNQADEARRTGKQLVFARTGTMLDPLLVDLQGLQPISTPQSSEEMLTKLLERFTTPHLEALPSDQDQVKTRFTTPHLEALPSDQVKIRFTTSNLEAMPSDQTKSRSTTSRLEALRPNQVKRQVEEF